MVQIPGRAITTLERLLSRYMGKRVRSKHVLALLGPRTPVLTRLGNLALNEVERRAGRLRLRSRPYTMLVDATNACNRRCPTCLTGQGLRGRPEGQLSLESFKRLLEPVARSLLLLEFNHWGEPLLNPQLHAMVRHAEQRGVTTSISTNGSLLTDEAVDALLDCGPSVISVAIDGLTDEVHRRHRGGERLQRTLGRVERLVQQRRLRGLARPLVEWQFIVFSHNEHQLDQARGLARSLGVDHIAFIGGYCDDPSWQPSDPRYRQPLSSYSSIANCSWPWTTLVVNWDGGVSPCCFGFYQQHDLGNLLQPGVSFDEVWNGPALQGARALLAAGRGHPRKDAPTPPTLCEHCRRTGQPALLRPGRPSPGVEAAP